MGAPELGLLVSFAVVLIGAEVGSLVFRWLRLPRVVGMIAAGAIVGPHVNPYADTLNLNPDRISDLAFLGGIFLMFSIGLSFNVRTFRRVGPRALLVSGMGTVLSFLAGSAVALAFHQPVAVALFLALILTPTSSVIAFRLAHDQNLLAVRGMETTMGGVILDDVVIIFLSTVVLALTGRQTSDLTTAFLGIILVLILAGIIVLLALQAVPRALHIFERLSGGNPTLLAVSLAFLVSFIFTLIDLPPIFGAFWAGSIIASSRFGDEVTSFIKPITELFSAVFFSAIGMLLDPRAFPTVGALAIGLALVGSAARFGGGFLALRSFKTPIIPALACASILIPRGEVSLVIAQYAGDPQLVQELQLVATVIVMATTLLAPLVFVAIRAVARRVTSRARAPAPGPAPPGS